MATSYFIYPGYSYGEKATPEQIFNVAKSINIGDLKEMFIAYGITDEYMSLLEQYKKIPSEDLTCRFDKHGIVMLASGAGKWREMKEAARRAFAILVLDECFRRNLSVNLDIK